MNEPFEYVRKYYGVPAEIGRKVTVGGRPGIIVQDRGHHIGVNFDDEDAGRIHPAHPTSDVEYLGLGKVRKLSRSKKRYADYLEVVDCCESFAEYLGIMKTLKEVE